MIKRKLKWAIVPLITAITIAGFSSFTDDSETPDGSSCYACGVNPNYYCEFSGNGTTIICPYRVRY